MTPDSFSRLASPAQTAAFAAACAERAAGILFWVVSEDGRRDDLHRYRDALEMLWSTGSVDPARCTAMRQELAGMREMSLGDEFSGRAAHALHAAVVLHSALAVRASGTAVTECAMAARNAAFRIECRTGRHLLAAEERCQAEDIDHLLAGAGVDEVREDARRHGRERLDLLSAHYRRQAPAPWSGMAGVRTKS